ncbi:MAG: hypothetical protein K0S23_3597 [Fluviicola sp.]|jgi:hypothetical protein|uniref:hypothetical protein n=1 Tax=Fluviicola sp. TaxID=1917219 RepID=UPI0026158AB8|nr:hypothetical protein [Fluviicola sp.]MDF3029290.1 hypothetical protein [Fluviicola sp.]
MSPQSKSIAYQILFFAGAILVLELLVSWIFDLIGPEPKSIDDLDRIVFRISVQNYLRLALLFLSAIVIAKKMSDLKYWKVAFALIGIIVLNYHLVYLYNAIDYYWIKGLGPQQGKQDLKSLLTLVSFEPTPPRYEPVNHLTDWQTLLYSGSGGGLSVMGLITFLFYGSICRALWVSAIVYFLFRKRRQRIQ